MKGEHHITRRLSYHNYCCIKHNRYINKQRIYCGNGAIVEVWEMYCKCIK